MKSSQVYSVDSEIFYRSLQLLHADIIALSEIVAPAAQILTIFILIAIPFSIINFWSWLDRYTMGFLLIIGTASFLLFFMIITFFSYVQEHSKKFQASHRQILNPLFLRSCQPLRWKMGTSYYITRNSFVSLLKNLVIKAIIKLILAF